LFPNGAIKAAINTTTRTVRFIFGNIECNTARWYQRPRYCLMGKKLRYGHQEPNPSTCKGDAHTKHPDHLHSQ
jgi:hypothetical protein